MNKPIFVSLLTGIGLLFVQAASFARPSASAAPRQQPQYVKDQVLIKFKPGVAATAHSQTARAYGASTMQTVGSRKDVILAKLIRGQSVEQAVNDLSRDPGVEYAQPNYIYHALAVPTDPVYAAGQLWAAKNTGQTMLTGSYVPATGTAGRDMNLEAAWNMQSDCSSVVVAVVDSGINYNSEDLSANMWTDISGTDTLHGRNFAADVTGGANSDPMDRNGHGTHVAGIIGAAANSVGGVGVCWSAKLMAVRVLEATGSGTTTSIVEGIDYAIANGAKVINMSLGGGSEDPTFIQAITDAQTAGVLVVVAAGNESNDNDVTSASYPCNYTQTNLICVAALDQNYALAGFSNWGSTSVDVGAPGTNIYSTWAGTSGTITDTFTAGWTYSSTTAGTGGGWVVNAYGVYNWLEVPGTSWGTATYNASTDDRAYKNFNLNGVDVATLSFTASVNITTGDWFLVNYRNAGGDPFVSPDRSYGLAGWNDGVTDFPSYSGFYLDGCRSATCTIGFGLLTNATLQNYGVTLTDFTISTLTYTTNGYNTANGTSMATPEVAGVAALVWAHNPSFTYADVAAAIRNGGDSIAALNGKTTTGKAVDALGSLTYINPPTGIAVTVH